MRGHGPEQRGEGGSAPHSGAHRPVVLALGRVVATPGALRAFEEEGASPVEYLDRHVTGDWGELDPEDWQTNDDALLEGARILSAYTLPATGTKVWIITEWDRSTTTLLLPNEY